MYVNIMNIYIYIYYGEYNNTGTYTADDIHIHALLLNVQIDEILMEMHGNYSITLIISESVGPIVWISLVLLD